MVFAGVGCGVMAGIGAAINTGEVGRGGATHMDNSRETELVGTIQDLTGRC
ncbi:hypothetical protein OG866_01180 [Streptomyces sp. NBC_00663]|uniref:hypothetical protein n=1 Tax=Streptomyces sp. NBC_00663 TaxID=2975801 RepID=UPI002E3221D1|nr:hypothetical protein [Streptomyces sp. NBC_00663]